ncbi:MAG: hypothetical protein WC346_06740 [Methanogenium sp.]|jgi:hypothetical protein
MENEKKLLSVHEIWKSKKIYWIVTYKTLLKYISKDYVDIFKPIVKGSRSGKRYFVTEDNLQEFIRKFEGNELAN